MKYTPVIGLEVHIELKTKSKMFCGCSADYFGKEPNSHTCPVCLGLPGALPVPNRQAIDWCILIALALNSEINEFSQFDRKNYFYPDLSKGYQISQYDFPFGKNGKMKLYDDKTVRIRRVHMEEDTGKLTHEVQNGKKISLIDFNRSGVPLVEIVTEPDFTSAKEVKEYLQRLQQIVRYLEVSNADMEKGDMRLEPNISLRKTGEKDLPPYKVEVKNINSFRFVDKAITFEIERQEKILEEGKIPTQETRGWNEDKGITFSQRVKEEANDYRYFPEPDIPPFQLSNNEISNLRSKVPELPDAKISRYTGTFSLPFYDAEILSRDKSVSSLFDEAVTLGESQNVSPKQIANAIINKKIDTTKANPSEIVGFIKNQTKVVQVDEDELQKIIDQVVKDNPKAVEDYKKGKENVIMFLVGQVLRVCPNGIDVNQVKSALISSLSK